MSSELVTSVNIFFLEEEEVHFKHNLYPKGTFCELQMGVLQTVCLQSNSSLSGSELYSQKVGGVVFGFTCCKHSLVCTDFFN